MKSRLKDSVLFSGISDAELELINQIGNLSKAAAGQFIFFENDSADSFYIVLEGKVKIFKTSPDGKEQVLLLPGPGESFGEAALFAKRIYPASAEVIEAAELVSFSRQAFLDLIRKHPNLAVNMIARLSMLLHHLTQIIQRLSLEDVTTRLAGYILAQLPELESDTVDKITLAEKKMILASLLGTIPETLSRSLARLSQQGIISVEGMEITIHNRKKLAIVASGEKS
jgi:CRP/FNR family transcriptional regulator